MFTRSTLPTLAAIASLACGVSAGAEAFDSGALLPGWLGRQNHSLSSSHALRGDTWWSLRSLGRDAILPSLPHASSLRSEFGAPWLGSSARGAPRAAGRLSFEPAADDVRAGSSASITLGRLNLSEPRSPTAALGGTLQADLDRELAQLRDGVNRVRLMPPVSLGMHIKF